MTEMLRGRIYRAHLTHIGEDKFFLVVSNNRRNRAFEQVLAALADHHSAQRRTPCDGAARPG